MKIDLFLYQIVQWKFLGREKIFQRKRCQRLGHASSNCQLPFRCVKCGGDHRPKACPITAVMSKDSLKCANYGQVGHPANYRGCIYYKHALSIINRNNTINRQGRQTKINKISKTVNSNISYTNITHAHSQLSTHTQHYSKLITQYNEQMNPPAHGSGAQAPNTPPP